MTNYSGPITKDVNEFIELDDCPSSYSGQSGKALRVNAGETGLEFFTAAGTGTVTSVAQTFTGGIVSVAGSPITTTGTLALTVAGTSGGIPYFSSSSAWASSSALAANGIVIGGGAGSAPSSLTAQTDGQFVVGNSSGAPVVISTLANGQTLNIGIVNATTTDTNDSIKITGQTAALSSSNPGYVALNDISNPGRRLIFKVTSDVTIKLTGATWGGDTLGDLTIAILCVYAINDAGSLKWGVGLLPNRISMTSAVTSATASNIDLPEEVLVNSAVSGTSPCAQIGYFYCSFDDTGGASENLWTVSSTSSNLVVGSTGDGLQREFKTSFGGFSANPTVLEATWTCFGNMIVAELIKGSNGTSNSIAYTCTVPFKASNTYMGTVAEYVNNGSAGTGAGYCKTTSASTTLNLYTNFGLGTWSNVNGKNGSWKVIFNAYTG